MTITAPYRALNAALHAAAPEYGAQGGRWLALVQALAERHQAASILDYGCGKNSLLTALAPRLPATRLAAYDPALPQYAAAPEPADLVVCTDVLEHIEPDALEAVLADLRRLALKAAFLVVSTRPARRILADGRNAHLIQQPPEWWLPRLWPHFQVLSFRLSSHLEPEDEFQAIVRPRPAG